MSDNFGNLAEADLPGFEIDVMHTSANMLNITWKAVSRKHEDPNRYVYHPEQSHQTPNHNLYNVVAEK